MTVPQFTFALIAICANYAATAQNYTAKEPQTIADSLEKSLARSDSRFFDAIFDKSAFAAKVAMTDESNPERATIFSKGMIDKILMTDSSTKTSVLATRLVIQQNFANKAFQLVKIRTRDEQPSLLYHSIDANGGVSYMEFILSAKAGNAAQNGFVINDIYLYAIGSYMSDNFRNSISEGYLNLYGKTTRNPIVKQLKVLKTIRRFEEEQRYDDAFRMTRILKTEKGSYWDKLFKIKRIIIAQKLYADDDAKYLQVLNDLQRNYPTDPATLLYAIDFYTLKKQYANAFKSVDALQKVTEDPFLNYLKANILLLQNDTEKAKTHLQACMIQLPKYDKPYFLLNDVLLLRKETAELPKLWNAMLLTLPVSKPNLTQKLAAMPEISALKEFQDWK